jgi:cobalamin biosynthesis protein CobT
MKKIFSIIIFLFSFITSAQEEPIRLVEEKQKKRTIIYVQNDTDTDKSVFLKVNPTGYRRSAQRPIIKNIPAKGKIQMLILIPLTDVESYYTYNLVVNEELETMDVKHDKSLKKKDGI